MRSASLALIPAALAAVLSSTMAASAQDASLVPGASGTPHVSVVAEGLAFGAPDIAMASLTVLRVAETADDALTEANEAAATLADAMREFGIESRDLQTGGFSVNPQYRYENRQDGTSAPPTIVGYEVRNTLAVRVRDLSRLGEILDRAVELGVNQGGNISLQIEDPSPLADTARRDAVEKARRSAETLAEAAGLELGRVVSIRDEDYTSQPMAMMAESRALAAPPAGDAVPVELGEIQVGARIRVTYALDGEAGGE